MTNDARLEALQKKYNKCLNDIKEKEIKENTQRIIEYRSHNKQKYLKKLFTSQNQQSVTQNLYYKGKYLPKNDAHTLYYKNIMQNSGLNIDPQLQNDIDKLKQQITGNTSYIEHTLEQVSDALNSTNPIGAVGYDKISQPHLKKLGNVAIEILLNLFDNWSMNSYIPSFVKC